MYSRLPKVVRYVVLPLMAIVVILLVLTVDVRWVMNPQAVPPSEPNTKPSEDSQKADAAQQQDKAAAKDQEVRAQTSPKPPSEAKEDEPGPINLSFGTDFSKPAVAKDKKEEPPAGKGKDAPEKKPLTLEEQKQKLRSAIKDAPVDARGQAVLEPVDGVSEGTAKLLADQDGWKFRKGLNADNNRPNWIFTKQKP